MHVKEVAVPVPKPRVAVQPNYVEDEFTTAPMKVAHRAKWKLPGGTLAELKAQLAKIERATVPSVEELQTQPDFVLVERAETEHKRLVTVAKTNEWRARTRLQAAIDTRSAVFKRKAAKRR